MHGRTLQLGITPKRTTAVKTKLLPLLLGMTIVTHISTPPIVCSQTPDLKSASEGWSRRTEVGFVTNRQGLEAAPPGTGRGSHRSDGLAIPGNPSVARSTDQTDLTGNETRRDSLILLPFENRMSTTYNREWRLDVDTPVKSSSDDGMRLGAAAGLILGVAFPHLSCKGECTDVPPGELMRLAIPVGVAVGAGLGTLIGSAIKKQE